MAALSTILAVTAIASSVASTVSNLTQKPPKPPAMPADAPDPAVDAARMEAMLSVGKRKAAVAAPNTSTLLTGPSGATAPAAVQRQSLLGL